MSVEKRITQLKPKRLSASQESRVSPSPRATCETRAEVQLDDSDASVGPISSADPWTAVAVYSGPFTEDPTPSSPQVRVGAILGARGVPFAGVGSRGVTVNVRLSRAEEARLLLEAAIRDEGLEIKIVPATSP